jgi:hypothetical protein
MKSKSNLQTFIASPLFRFLLFGLSALVLTYPLLLSFFSRIPLGDEKVGTVPFFNLWTLQWNIDQLLRGYPGYWNAPIFAPLTGTFAFSETQLMSALLAAPLWLGLQSPAIGYNSLVLFFLTCNGWFGYWLLKQWSVSGLVAFLTGLIIQALPFVAQETGVLQLVAIFGFLWSLLFLSRFLAQRRRGQTHWPTIICLALGLPVTFFTCSYYGLFSLLFLPLAFLFLAERFDLKAAGQLLLAGVLSLALAAPLIWTQQQQLAQYGFSRSAQTIENNSARLIDYTYTLDHNLLYGRLLARPSPVGQRLFPGLGLILPAALAIWGRPQRRVKLYLAVAVILALLLSLGLRLRLGELQPYQWLRDAVPGLAQLRSPFRFAMLVQLHLALLAGFGLTNLRRWLPDRPAGLAVLVAVAALVLLESLALPLPLQPLPPLQRQAPWQNWLNTLDQPPRLVMLPFAPTSAVADFEQTTLWMLESRYFQGRMLNGYSGFFPRDHAKLREHMRHFPTLEGLALLRQMQVDYVIVHHQLPQAPPPESVLDLLPPVYHDRQNNVSIYALN